ncbi:MAG: indole-3-glycerol phosphate synthase TrpC [Alphaproteobacteria bacterium]|nr:indole-3-glycerol phosphate synthase TrpC [Alphaproteobacteria bacterium]
MSDILKKICDDKREHVEQNKGIVPLNILNELISRQEPCRGFAASLSAKVDAGGYGLIAEVKKASPSAGVIREDFNPEEIAMAYERAGASCISVLTDEQYFQGHNDYLVEVMEVVSLPLLRKDFMVDMYQITESRALGADCILLIMGALDDGFASEMEAYAFELGMDVLVEVHDEEELERALKLKTPLLGINNRDLKKMKTDIATTERLAAMVPDDMDKQIVSESGLYTKEDLDRMANAGAKRFLVGQSLMSQNDIELATRTLLGFA